MQSFFYFQLHADKANWLNAIQNDPWASFMCQNPENCNNIQVIFDLKVVKENNDTLQVAKKFNFTPLFSKIQKF